MGFQDERWSRAQQYEIRHWKNLLEEERRIDWYEWKARSLKEFLIASGFSSLASSGCKRILEVGSGPVGTIASWEYGEKFAVEPLCKFFEQVEEFKKYRKFPVQYMEGMAEKLPFVDDFFDLIIIDNVLDHTSRPPKVLRELKRTLRPGGVIYLALNVRSVPGARIRNILEKHLEFDKGHPHSFDLQSLKSLIKSLGLNIASERKERLVDSISKDVMSEPLKTAVKCITLTIEMLYEALLSK